MANFELIFIDELTKHLTAEVKLVTYVVKGEEKKFIDIEIEEDGHYLSAFTMSKSTAIKFAKTLRTEINKITESEVNHG